MFDANEEEDVHENGEELDDDLPEVQETSTEASAAPNDKATKGPKKRKKKRGKKTPKTVERPRTAKPKKVVEEKIDTPEPISVNNIPDEPEKESGPDNSLLTDVYQINVDGIMFLIIKKHFKSVEEEPFGIQMMR